MKLNIYQIMLIFLLVGFGGGIATKGLIDELKKSKPAIVQLNPDLSNLNTQVAVLKGQVSSINEQYNDYGVRLRIIEERMVIFNRGD
jgi:hypothetical protein